MKMRTVAALAAALTGAGWASAQGPGKAEPGPVMRPETRASSLPAVVPPAAHAPAAGGPISSAHAPVVSGPSVPAPSSYLLPETGCGDGSCGTGGCASGLCGGWANGQCCWTPYQYYGGAEYLLWKIRSPQLPALAFSRNAGVITFTSANTFTPVGNVPTPPDQIFNNFAPVFVTSTATPAQTDINLGESSGVRYTFGYWFDPDQTCGVEASFFHLERRTGGFSVNSGNNNNTFVIDTGVTNQNFLVTPATGDTPPLVSLNSVTNVFFVRQTTGSIVGTVSNQLWGGEINARSTWATVGPISIGGLLGFRYLNYREDLNVQNTASLFQPLNAAGGPQFPDPAGATFPPRLDLSTVDRISTRNQFYGAQIGINGETCCGMFYFNARGKIAVGGLHQTVDIVNGSTFLNPVTGQTQVNPGGLLTGAGDAGHFTRNRVSFIPEANLRVGVILAPWCRVYMGYDAMYIDQVARPINQIGVSTLNTTVQVANSTNQINVQQASSRFGDRSLYVEGLNAGVELRY